MNSMTQPSKPASQFTDSAPIRPAEIDHAAQVRQSLRQQLLQQRRAIHIEQRRLWDQRIGEQVRAWCVKQRPPSLGIYWPIQGEADLLPIYPELHALGIALCLPLVLERNQPLQFLSWQPNTAMTLDAYKIPVPQHQQLVPVPAAMLIPCVGFNAKNYRLGYGGGFYDRTLLASPDRIAIGIAYQQALTSFTPDAHDIPMSTIITEAE